MNWSDKTWEQTAPIYKSIIDMPFIKELGDGSLPMEKFQFYMAQDSGYLEHFGRALCMIAARAHDKKDTLDFIRFAEGAIVVEKALHESYFKTYGVSPSNIVLEPACHHYVHYLKSTTALDSIEVAMAAVLPCFWIYKRVGDHILSQRTNNNNPYQQWIDTYAGEDFGTSVRQAITICDRMAERTTAVQQQAMTQAFLTSSRLEFDFWESAYHIRKWPTIPGVE